MGLLYQSHDEAPRSSRPCLWPGLLLAVWEEVLVWFSGCVQRKDPSLSQNQGSASRRDGGRSRPCGGLTSQIPLFRQPLPSPLTPFIFSRHLPCFLPHLFTPLLPPFLSGLWGITDPSHHFIVILNVLPTGRDCCFYSVDGTLRHLWKKMLVQSHRTG